MLDTDAAHFGGGVPSRERKPCIAFETALAGASVSRRRTRRRTTEDQRRAEAGGATAYDHHVHALLSHGLARSGTLTRPPRRDGSGHDEGQSFKTGTAYPTSCDSRTSRGPVASDDEVRVRVQAAAVEYRRLAPAEGHAVPHAHCDRAVQAKAPRSRDSIWRVELQVEVGKDVSQFDRAMRLGWCRGAFAEYACAGQDNFLPKPANLTLEQSAAVGDSAFTALTASRSREGPARARGVDQRGGGGRGHVRRADRQIVRSDSGGRLQYEERGPGPIDWRRRGHRLHAGGLRPGGRRYDVMLDLVGSRSLSDCRRALTSRGTYVLVGVADMGRWFGVARQIKVLSLSPLVRQKMRVFIVRHNQEDLMVLKARRSREGSRRSSIAGTT